jgi:3D (Asp-Asp-Asp) domain-containing protein
VSQQVGYTLGLLTPAREVTIVADGQEMTLALRVATVEEALAAAKIVLGEHDRVSPEPAGKIQDQMEIVVTRVTKSQIVEHERIYFHEIRRANHNLERGVTRTLQRGREGRRAEHYEVVYENGQRVSKTLLRSEVLEPKVDRIVEYGTIGSLSRGGNTYRFTRVLYVIATAYTAGPESTGKSPGHPAFGITRSGLPVEVGHIAVDPDVIPLLSHVYVEGLCAFSAQFSGRYLATDTGSAIQGNRIDIYFERVEDAIRFGRRRMRVYVLAR